MNTCFSSPLAEAVAVSAGFATIRWTKLGVREKINGFHPVAQQLPVFEPMGSYFPVRTFVRCSL